MFSYPKYVFSRGRLKAVISLSAVSAVLAFAVLAAGCGEQAKDSAAKQTKTSSEAFPAVVKDDAGRSIEIKSKPEKIVSISPTDTEILFALGLGDKIVGVSTYCDYPAEAKNKEKVGDFANPNLERILALQPDIVFAAAGVQEPVLKRLGEAGIKVFVVDPKSIDGIVGVIERVGMVTGSDVKGKELADSMRKRIAAVEDKAREAKVKPSVFYEVYSQPLMTAGGPSLINDMIKTAGGVNIAGDVEKEFPQYSLETLIEKNPSVYITSTGSMQEPGELGKRPGWEKIDAVKAGRVFVFDDNLMSRYGPRFIDALEKVAKAIHPELY